MGSPEISVGGPLTTILCHFFEKPVLRLTAKNDIFFENSRENLKGNFLHLAFFLNFFSLFFVERCISTNSSPIPSKFVLEKNTIIDVNLRKIYARALPRACAVAIFSRASSKKCCRKTGFSKKWHKIVVRTPPSEISGDPACFDRKFFQNDFGVGASDQWFLALFSIFDLRNFDHLGKTVFFERSIFSKKQQKQQCCFFGAPWFFPKKKKQTD